MSEQAPLDPELAALVAAERRYPGMPTEAGERLLNRLLSLPPGGGDGPAQHDPPDGDKSGGDTSSNAAAAAGPAAGRALLTLTFAAGGLCGALGHAIFSRPPSATALSAAPAGPVTKLFPPSPKVRSAAPPPALPAATPSSEVPGAAGSSVPASRTAAHTAPAAPQKRSAPPQQDPASRGTAPIAPAPGSPPRDIAAPPHDAALAAERAVVEIARTAIGRGRPDEALAAVERHERQFPDGRLAEEREVLRVQALALGGRRTAAQSSAAAFRRRFPGSLLQPIVDAALEEAP